LKIGGTDSESCITYESACGTLDYIMLNKEDNEYGMLNNTNGDHTVYIDTGIHNYTLISQYYPYFSPFLPLLNVVFTLRAYLSSSSFSSSDINTYPVILTNSSSNFNSPFFLFYDISSFFHYLKFLIGKASGTNGRFFIWSFCFYLFFICICIF
jgi:hypothetical protein